MDMQLDFQNLSQALRTFIRKARGIIAALQVSIIQIFFFWPTDPVRIVCKLEEERQINLRTEKSVPTFPRFPWNQDRE